MMMGLECGGGGEEGWRRTGYEEEEEDERGRVEGEEKRGGGGEANEREEEDEEEETMTRRKEERMRGSESEVELAKGFVDYRTNEKPPLDPPRGPTTQMLERACSSALTRYPPKSASTSRPADLARSTLGSSPTAATRWSVITCRGTRPPDELFGDMPTLYDSLVGAARPEAFHQEGEDLRCGGDVPRGRPSAGRGPARP